MPTPINDRWQWITPDINHLLESAAVKLGELNCFARLVPNIDLFIQLHVTKEAVVSSRIEGTQTNIDEALLPEEEIRPERRNDWKEVKKNPDGTPNKFPVALKDYARKGPIGFQGLHGKAAAPVWYRNIKIKALD